MIRHANAHEFPCPDHTCNRTFTTQEGAKQHYAAKHGGHLGAHNTGAATYQQQMAMTTQSGSPLEQHDHPRSQQQQQQHSYSQSQHIMVQPPLQQWPQQHQQNGFSHGQLMMQARQPAPSLDPPRYLFVFIIISLFHNVFRLICICLDESNRKQGCFDLCLPPPKVAPSASSLPPQQPPTVKILQVFAYGLH